jgi:Ca2+-binding EF-hand superfamily protein
VGQQTTPMKIYQIVSKYDSDASGEIDICEYLNFMQEFKAEENEAMRQKFQELDEDDSGELGLAELELALLSLGRDPTKEQMKEMLATFDTDGSLTFSFEEFRGMVQLLAEMEKKLAYDNAGFSEEELEGIREQFLHHDKDRSGELSFNELVGVIADLGLLPRTKEQQKRLVEKMNSLDSDGSGQLSFGEFVHLFRRFLDEAESLEFDKERIAATEIGLSPNELDDFRAAYDQSLTDLGGGVMDFTVSSTRTFLRMAGIQLSPQEMAELKTIFNKYAVEVGRNDNKDSPVAHSLPFPAFLRFVGHILSINFACIADRTERIVEKSLEDSTKLTLLISKVEEQKDKVQRSRDSATSERRPSHTRLPQI